MGQAQPDLFKFIFIHFDNNFTEKWPTFDGGIWTWVVGVDGKYTLPSPPKPYPQKLIPLN